MSFCTLLQTYPRAIDPFAEDADSHSGLDFAYGAGRVRDDNAVTNVAAGTVTLADDTTNYIEVDPETGTVSANTTGFTSGKLPLYTVVTASGAISTVQDDRCFFSSRGGAAPDSGFGFVAVDVEASDVDYAV